MATKKASRSCERLAEFDVGLDRPIASLFDSAKRADAVFADAIAAVAAFVTDTQVTFRRVCGKLC